ncbi:MAG: monovalent cation/H(+) antiporter subunit G [Betaproteobacteria bacterium]|nr:monovalent cation/H(+) antiporter subunit G [Betaproteobacteria bacterium]
MTPLEIVAMVLLTVGGVFCVIGAVGLVRMPDFYTRMHAASVIETLGAGLVLVGLMLLAGFTLASAKLVILGALIFFASPTATHALAKAAHESGLEPATGGEREKGPE